MRGGCLASGGEGGWVGGGGQLHELLFFLQPLKLHSEGAPSDVKGFLDLETALHPNHMDMMVRLAGILFLAIWIGRSKKKQC